LWAAFAEFEKRDQSRSAVLFESRSGLRANKLSVPIG
jgi:hypothetical protein